MGGSGETLCIVEGNFDPGSNIETQVGRVLAVWMPSLPPGREFGSGVLFGKDRGVRDANAHQAGERVLPENTTPAGVGSM